MKKIEKICENIIENNFGNYILKEKFLFYLFNKLELNHFFLNLIMKYPFIIRNIDNPTEEMKLLAVKQNGNTIQHIQNPTDEMKWLAIKSNGFAIQYIDNPTEEMKLLAVKNNGYAIKYIDNPTEEMKIISYQNRFKN